MNDDDTFINKYDAPFFLPNKNEDVFSLSEYDLGKLTARLHKIIKIKEF